MTRLRTTRRAWLINRQTCQLRASLPPLRGQRLLELHIKTRKREMQEKLPRLRTVALLLSLMTTRSRQTGLQQGVSGNKQPFSSLRPRQRLPNWTSRRQAACILHCIGLNAMYKPTLCYQQGQGTKLGDIPNIAFRLSKVTGKDELLEDLHQICYGSKGKVCLSW